MQFDKDLQLIYITEVTKKDIMSGLSNISQGYVDKGGTLWARNSKGQLFRKDEYGAIVFINDKEQLHRLDGPAVEGADGVKYWYLNGIRHREDGPALEYAVGSKYWYLNGVKYTEPQWRKKVKELQLK